MRQSIRDIFRWFPIWVYRKVILGHEAIVKPVKNQCEIFDLAILVPEINEADVSLEEHPYHKKKIIVNIVRSFEKSKTLKSKINFAYFI